MYDTSKEMDKGAYFDSSNILNIESLLPFIFSYNMKEKEINGRVLCVCVQVSVYEYAVHVL